MSTFKGIITEFPQIRIDYFRQQPGLRAPLACFLSHVHSDHLTGLESMRAPFVYCSAATKEMLLRLEKSHYRINFANGILESRNVTYDRSIRKLAKPLPLDTPTTIELAPGNSIRVTLIDANHCVGAVMFLIESEEKAVLYTGDVRAETWWVNTLIQNPVLLPYTLGDRRLDCMYLDTTFATKSEPYKEFPSKAEGIQELLHKVSQYSDDTIFYFHSWTFGYEHVWVALSAFLKSRIHLDDYRARVYGSLSTLDKRQLREVGLNVQTDNKSLRESGLEIREAPALCGFRNGNHVQPGCLTSRESVRIHSCERGMGCRILDHDKDAKLVHIIPIVTRANGTDIAELGAGGGKGDLDQKEELETGDAAEIGKLIELCGNSIKDKKLLSNVLTLLQTLAGSDGKLSLDMRLPKDSGSSQDDFSLQTLVSILSANASRTATTEEPCNRTIRFPYSRHSSYAELRNLVAAFNPKDIFPCTVDEDSWTPDMSMEYLFGDLCNNGKFRHDAEMIVFYTAKMQRLKEKRKWEETQEDTQAAHGEHHVSPIVVECSQELEQEQPLQAQFTIPVDTIDFTCDRAIETDAVSIRVSSSPALVSNRAEFQAVAHHDSTSAPFENSNPRILALVPELSKIAQTLNPDPVMEPSVPTLTATSVLSPSCRVSSARKRRKKLTNRQLAYEAAIGTHLTWIEYGGLTSTRKLEDRDEKEL